MMGNLGLKPLNDESVKFLEDLYDKLTVNHGSDTCYFCHGGNTCRCGHCPEVEYHDIDCITTLLDMMIHSYRHPREGVTHTMVLMAKEEIEWYRKRIEELEEKVGDDF